MAIEDIVQCLADHVVSGEFGVVYATEEVDGADWIKINEARYGALREQLRIYKQDSISWTIWLYKVGARCCSPASATH